MDPNQPSGNNAGATGTPSQAPQHQPSGPQADANQPSPTLTFDSFDEDQKKYLAGQGITSQEQLTVESLTKVINHARSSQQTAQERQAEIDKLKNSVGTQNPTGPTNAPSDGGTGPQSNTQAPAAGGLSETDAFILAGTLSTQYPKLQEKLASGKFYEEMEKEGYPLAKADGTANLANIQRYAQRATKEIELEEKLAAANKPDPIPDPSGGQARTIDANTPMDKNLARAIVMTDKSNTRFAEAQKYLQDNVGRK